MKFKVGDRIKRVSGEIGDRLKIGDIGIIKKILIGTNSYRVINERTREVQTWGDYYIDIEPSQTIVIYPKGLETIALLKEGKKVIKQASAKCNPTDVFDFNVGVKLAFSRLMGEEKTEDKAFNWEGFKQGKFAVHCDTEEKAKAFLKECDEQGIKWAGGDKTTSKTLFPCDRTYGILYFCHGSYITYSINPELYEDENIVECPSSNTIREVKRPAKVGEWIKIVDADGWFDEYENGDVFKVDELYTSREEGIISSPHHIVPREYVVLEDYQPEAKPFFSQTTIDEISRYTDKELINELSRRWEDKQ